MNLKRPVMALSIPRSLESGQRVRSEKLPRQDTRGKGGATWRRDGSARLLLLVVSSLLLATAPALRADRLFVSDEHLADELATLAEETAARIENRLSDYETVLRSGARLFGGVAGSPTRSQWSAWTAGLAIAERFPEIEGVGYIHAAAPADRPALEASLRRQGLPDARITPVGTRDRYSAILFAESTGSRNRDALGYDLYTHPPSRAAMDRAQASGVMAAAEFVSELPFSGRAAVPRFLAFYPVRSVADAGADETAVPAGFVFIHARAPDLFGALLDAPPVPTMLSVRETRWTGEDDTVFTNRGAFAGEPDLQTRSVDLEAAGRLWQIDVGTTRGHLETVTGHHRSGLAAAAVILNILLAALLLGIAHQKRRMQRTVVQCEREAARARALLEASRGVVDSGVQSYGFEDGKLDLDARARALLAAGNETAPTMNACLDRVPAGDRERVEAALFSEAEIEGDGRLRFRIADDDGQQRTIEAHVVAERNAEQCIIGKSATLREVAEEAVDDGQLLAMQSAWQGINDALVIMDPNLRILDANPAFCRMSGFPREEVIGRTPRLYKSRDGDRSGYREMLRTLREEGAWEGRCWNTQKNGDVFVARERVWAIRDARGTVTHYVAAITDVTESVMRESRLQDDAAFDTLTGLPNRTQLREAAISSIAAAHLSSSVTAILYIDIDRFKAVNDRFDHRLGDELLIEVGERLRSLAGPTDHVGRNSGDEFVMILNDLLDESHVEEHAERVLGGLRGTYTLSNHHKVYLSASIGVSTFPRGGADCENLLRQADRAMYAAKDRGRDRYEIFDIAESQQADEQRRQIKRIEYAIKDEEFVLYYQPKINMRTGAVIGAEALLRWKHPEDGIIPPDRFLPLVAGSQQGADIDRWVIGEALRQIEKLRSAGFEIPISVNVDGAYLQQVDFLDQLSRQLDRYPNLPRHLLELEILESVALSDLKNMGMVIDQLHELGLAVALDDFGTGYSSLTYLKELPTDTLKIDKSFVIDMFNDTSSFSLVEGIISLASNFGRDVIAEGVETERHGLALVRMGCEHGQGYGIQHPLPVDEFMEWICTQDRKASAGAGDAANVVWIGRPDAGKG